MYEAEKHCLSLCSFIISTFFGVIFSIDVESQGVCNEALTGCCSGYFWSYNNNTCLPCMLGYDGINCTNSCPYPAYGEGCQGICYCEKDMCDVSTGCEPNTTETISSVETTTIENATYQITTTSVLGELFRTPLSKTNKDMLFFIKMIGGIDIILLSAYLGLCMYDRKRREKSPKFSSSGQQTSGRSTAYENIEFGSFFSAR